MRTSTTLLTPNALRAALHSVRRRVGAIPVVGNLARYLKRLILLPWNLVKYLEQAQRRDEALARQLAEIQTSLDTQVRAEVRQLKYRYAEFYGILSAELRAQGEVLRQTASDLRELKDPRP